MTKFVITVPNDKNSDTWFRFINSELKQLKIINPASKIIVDFNIVDTLQTDDLVILACLIESYFNHNLEIEFIGGTYRLKKQLADIQYTKFWDVNFDRNQYIISNNQTALGLWKISKERVYDYSRFARDYFTNKFFGNKNLLPLATNLDEVFNNILDHSKAEIAFVLTQYSSSTNLISFSICDFGIGIPKSVNNFKQASKEPAIEDWRALSLSTQLGFSVQSTPRNRGFGLDNILSLVNAFNGEITIISNNGALKKSADKFFQLGETNYSFSGTLVKVNLDVARFDELDDSENIFEF